MSEMYWLNPFYEAPDPEPILRDAFDWQDNGIFVAMKNYAALNEIEIPWGDEDPETLDLAYFGNHSGGKFCAPIVKLFLATESLVDENGRINSTGTQKLAAIFLCKYLTNWKHLWDVNEASYNPISNYDIVENRVARKAHSFTENGSRDVDETITHGKSSNELASRFGVNTDSNSPKPVYESTVTDSGTTGTATETTDSRNRVGAGEEEEEFHKSGNIGVTTTQKMIQEERELWIWNYFDQIFDDLDRELALMFHDSCRV